MSSADGQRRQMKATSAAEGNGRRLKVTSSADGASLSAEGLFTTPLIYQYIHCIKAFVIIWHVLLALVPCLLTLVPPNIFKSTGQLALPSSMPNSRPAFQLPIRGHSFLPCDREFSIIKNKDAVEVYSERRDMIATKFETVEAPGELIKDYKGYFEAQFKASVTKCGKT